VQKQKQSGGRIRPAHQHPAAGCGRIPIARIPASRAANQPAQHRAD